MKIGDLVIIDREYIVKGKQYHSIYEAEIARISPNERYVKIKHEGSDKEYWVRENSVKENLSEDCN